MGRHRSEERAKETAAPFLEHEVSAVADLDASIAENAIRMAHLYCERAKMSNQAADHQSAALDKSRADSLYQWAMQAAAFASPAGRDVLEPELDKLKAELDAFELAKGVSAR